MDKLGQLGVMLAVSLHACNDELRDVLVPINKKYNLEALFKAIRAYPDLSNSKRVTFESVSYTHLDVYKRQWHIRIYAYNAPLLN